MEVIDSRSLVFVGLFHPFLWDKFQPIHIGVIIQLLSTMDILVGFQTLQPLQVLPPKTNIAPENDVF